MKTLKLVKVEHKTKIGSRCEYVEPNVTEDCLLESDGEIIGFYIKDVSKYSERLKSFILIADKEFNGDNVPKSLLERTDVFQKVYQ